MSIHIAGAESVGVCYGRNGNNLPSEQSVINLYKANNIKRMRLYDPVPAALNALRGTDIELILDVPNPDLQSLTNPSTASDWVRKNIISYTPGVRFKYIAVGNEIDPNSGTSQYTPFLLSAIQNVYNAIVSAGLQNQIKVSTATYSGLIAPSSSPPSNGAFRDDVKSFIDPIIGFLARNNLPLLVNIYPYFSYTGSSQISINYALFTAPNVVVQDGDLSYRNLFDALLDVQYSALEKSGGGSVQIVVSESGWPSAGGNAASVENAQTYYRNLIDHVRGNNGTPKRPGRGIETYLFAMFDENVKNGNEIEKHFGLFTPNQQPKYQLSFN